MKKSIQKISFLGILLFLFSSTSIISQNVDKWFQDGIIIFQLKTNSSIEIKTKNIWLDFKNIPLLNQFTSKYKINSVKQLYANHPDEKLSITYQIEFDEILLIEKFITDLNSITSIEYAEKKELHANFLTPNDQNYVNSTSNGQWALFKINAEQAWDISTGSSSVIVGVTDNAININHPDLTNKMLQGYDAANNDNDPTGCGSNTGFHGSHVSGIVGAESNNSIGIASIGYDISILPVKIGNCNGSLTAGYEGIVWAADNGADIINMSWGGGGSSTYGQNVCNYASNEGSILVAAAGNDGVSSVFYPAGYNNVVSVASTTTTDAKSSFSNYGSWIDISSPGSTILSCNQNSSYQTASGTSMASPLVAGLLGLMKSYAPNATNQDLINCLYSSAANIDAANSNYVGQLGAGRIDASQALTCLNAFSFSLDAAISEITEPEGNICGGTISPVITLRNYGSSTLTSIDINYQISGSILQTYNWTGTLTSGQNESISLPTQIIGDGNYTLTAYTSNPNGSTDQNPSNDQETSSFTIVSNGQTVNLSITTDCYGDEITWSFADDQGNTVHSGGPYTNIAGGQTYTSQICLAPGCYDFYINDSYGDGMYGSQWQTCSVDGDYYIEDANNNTLVQMTAANADFGYGTYHNFCIVSPNINYDAGIQTITSPSASTCNPSITPEIILNNYGNQALTYVEIHYQIGNGATQIYNWTGVLNAGQNTTVSLPLISMNNGLQSFTVYTSNPNGNTDQNLNNDTAQSQVTVFTNSISLPFTESFENNGFITNSWTINNPDNSITWDIVSVTGSSPGGNAAKMGFFQYNQVNQRDGMITPPMKFTGYSTLDLSFEHAYRRYDQNSTDSLIVSISTDCGQTYTRILEAGENGTGSFATAYTSTTNFTPQQTNDWCMGNIGANCFTLNLDNYLGNSSVMIKFESYNAGTNGNNLFIDNINIDGTPNSTPPTAGFSSNNTNLCEGNPVIFNDQSLSNITSWTWSFPGGNPSTSTLQNPTITYNTNGIYDVTLIVTNNSGSDTIVSANYITVNSTNDASFSVPADSLCTDDPPIIINTNQPGGIWTGNGITNSGLFDPIIAGAGTHFITYSLGGICPSYHTETIVVETSVTASINSVSNICNTAESILLTGNPNGGSWSGTGITNNINGLFNPSVAGIGTHIINYTIDGLCGDVAMISIVVDDCTSISDSKNESIELFPNPNSGEFRLIINKTQGCYENNISIINHLGEIVYYEEINQSNNTYIKQLNLTSLSDGIYYLKFSNSVIKFIKL